MTEPTYEETLKQLNQQLEQFFGKPIMVGGVPVYCPDEISNNNKGE